MRYELSVFGTRYVVEELDTKAYRGSINRNSTMRRADLSLMTHIAPSVDLYGLAGGHTPGRLRREGSAVIGGRLR